MKLDHVPVGEDVIAIHLLPVEARRAPDARVLDALGHFLVNREGQGVYRGAPLQHERPLEIGLLPGLLRVDPDPIERAEEKRTKVLEPGSMLGGYGMKGNPARDGL